MLANLLKYGKNSVLLLDATPGTNHMKMPLYTGIVIDEFGQGVQAFMVLVQNTYQADLNQWMSALLCKVQEDDPAWKCSCIIFDDAVAEINAVS